MTTAEKVELTRRSYAAFNAGDADAVVALYDPDCEWALGGMAMAAGREAFYGHDGLREWVEEMAEASKSLELTFDEVRSDGDALLVAGLVRGTSSGVEAPLLARFWQRIEFRDRRILRVLQDIEPPSGWDTAVPIDLA